MEWLFVAYFALHHALAKFFHLLCRWIYRKKPEVVPASRKSLLTLSATSLAKKIRDGEVSSQTVVEAYIERIKEVNPFLNAVVEDRFEAAIAQAKAYDEALRTGSVLPSILEKEKPLYGVPITVKESCGLKGLSHTGCTLARKGIKAQKNGALVDCMEKAGAIPLCVTNTPELCTSLHSDNKLYGATKNAYDGRRTAGGSSGGEGALIGAGASVVGIGSDIAGSIRAPALFNGIFGHKPSPGIVPSEGHFPLPTSDLHMNYLTLGPLTRYAEDLHLTMKVMTSNCNYDLRLDEPVDLKNLRVYYTENINTLVGTTSKDIKQKIKDATNYFTEKGCNVKKLPDDMLDDTMYYLIACLFRMKGLPKLFLTNDNSERSVLCEIIKVIFRQSDYTWATIYVNIMTKLSLIMTQSKASYYTEKLEELRQNVKDLLKNDGVIVCPAYKSAADFPIPTIVQVHYMADNAVFNLLHCPAVYIPMGLNKEGLPIGFQVVAGPYQDRLCLAVAKKLEEEFGGWVPPWK